jgi:hypothetical protein
MKKLNYSNYELNYHLPQFASRRIQIAQVHEFILANCKGDNWRVEKAGHSLQERPIYQVTYGSGPIKILLWSQMHGNEATATRALLELFQFLNSPDSPVLWANELSLHFLPLLNPDGAAKHTRENAAGIDLNRDAIALSALESAVLNSALNSIKPDFSFNLHDQQIYYGVGNPCKQSAISLLAPPIDDKSSMNPNREKAAKMVAVMEKWLRSELKLTVGKWSDEYEKRAFGEYCQEFGSATILIEAGGLPNDLEKTTLTKHYFSLLLFSIQAILDRSYEKESLSEYEAIPFQRLGVFDLIIRNAEVIVGNNKCKVDIGIRREDYPTADGKSLFQIGKIAEIGDLVYASGLEEWDAKGASFAKQKFPNLAFENLPATNKALELMRQGFGAIQVKNISKFPDYMHFPLLINEVEKEQSETKLTAGEAANFCLIESDTLVANIVNGYLHLID